MPSGRWTVDYVRLRFAAVKPKSKTKASSTLPTWLTPEGEPVSCIEKIKVLNENLEEIQALAQDALEDAVLMGCDEAAVLAKVLVNRIWSAQESGQSLIGRTGAM